MVAEGVTPLEVARRLRVLFGVRVAAALAGRRQAALASRGPGGAACQVQTERSWSGCGPHWRPPGDMGRAEDQRWTLERVAALIGRLFHVRRYTLRGTSFLLHRLGFSPQVPVHRAAERDEDAIAEWRAVTWAKVRG